MPDGELVHTLSAVAAVIDHIHNTRKRQISGQTSGVPVAFAKRRIAQLTAGEDIIATPCEVDAVDGGYKVQIFNADGTPGHAHLLRSDWKPGDAVWSGTIDADQVAVQVRTIPNGYALAHRGIATKARVYTELSAGLAALMPKKENAGGGKELLCPMPGLVVSIAVVPGQEVKNGEILAIVEAMKMENVLRAERDGIIKAVHAKAGDSLAVDAVILEFA